jgi:hypothetical protein
VKDSAMLQSSLQVGLNNNVDIRYPLLKTELIINYQYIDDNNDKSTDNNDYRNRQKALKNVSELNLDNLYLSIETLKSIFNIPILKMNYNVYDFIMKERNIYTAYVMVRERSSSSSSSSSSSNDRSDKREGQDGVNIMVNKNTLDLFNVKYSIWIKSKSE